MAKRHAAAHEWQCLMACGTSAIGQLLVAGPVLEFVAVAVPLDGGWDGIVCVTADPQHCVRGGAGHAA